MSSWLTEGENSVAERGKFGFAEADWWNGDKYLCGVIGTMALKHRDSGNGHPAHLTEGEWREILTKIGEPLVAYATAGDSESGTAARLVAARAAMHLFADWFEHFWD